ncbi:MAG: hypothetical protein ACMG6H_11290, partial [Acidobacteriota bacterium]
MKSSLSRAVTAAGLGISLWFTSIAALSVPAQAQTAPKDQTSQGASQQQAQQPAQQQTASQPTTRKTLSTND